MLTVVPVHSGKRVTKSRALVTALAIVIVLWMAFVVVGVVSAIIKSAVFGVVIVAVIVSMFRRGRRR